MKLLVIVLAFIGIERIQAQSVISFDSTQKFQTIDGWEAVSNEMEPETLRDTLMPHLDSLIHCAIHEAGITRLRYSLKSGCENPTDYFGKMLNEGYLYDSFKTVRYSKINDNNDPFTSDPKGFQTTGMDHNVRHVMKPFRDELRRLGDSFYLNLCFVDFVNQSAFHHTQNPEEYAEFIQFYTEYLDTQHHFVPHGIEIILEPDNADVWNQKHVAKAIEATGNRLENRYPNIEIIAPSVMSMGSAAIYLAEIEKNPKALAYMDVLSYHRYSGSGDSNKHALIRNWAALHHKKLGMLEYDKNGDVEELHYDLKYNNNTAWTKYALFYKTNEKFAYVYVDRNDPSNPKYDLCDQTKFLQHYFKNIRPGATRIASFTNTVKADPVAFINKNGALTFVVKTNAKDTLRFEGLPPGEYKVSYSTGNYHWAQAPKVYNKQSTQTLLSSQALNVYVPDRAVVSVVQVIDEVSKGSQYQTPQLAFYPNPVAPGAPFTIESSSKIVAATWYDALGRRLEDEHILGFLRAPNKPGIYFVWVETLAGAKGFKVCVE